MLPPVVHPDPLLGMFPDSLLDQGGASIRHPPNPFRDRPVVGGTVLKAEGWSKPDLVTIGRDARREGGQDGHTPAEGNPGNSRMGSRSPAEKGGKESFGRGRTLVHGQNDDLVSVQGFQHAPDSVVLG